MILAQSQPREAQSGGRGGGGGGFRGGRDGYGGGQQQQNSKMKSILKGNERNTGQ